ncbi:DinB family protein [Hylemonella gracilis ATCC 19624]|uniref:DinB family protein n=2 Tax=Hylemonella gracilis TaxID=80880 RepID=F3KS54_9BURK|nr:DinB family protein [Hylemonella gracilis ATCC 19624]
MADYNRWMNTKLYEAAGQLSDAQLRQDRGAFFGSLYETLNHLAVADTIWLQRFAQHPALGGLQEAMQGFPKPTSLREPMAASFAELWDYRTRLDAVILQFAQQLTPAHLAETLRYANTSGKPQARNVGALLQHFFNHQTHHRGQASTLLFQAGVDVGVTDLFTLIPNEV